MIEEKTFYKSVRLKYSVHKSTVVGTNALGIPTHYAPRLTHTTFGFSDFHLSYVSHTDHFYVCVSAVPHCV